MPNSEYHMVPAQPDPFRPSLTLEIFDILRFGYMDVPGAPHLVAPLVHGLVYVLFNPSAAYYGRDEEYGTVLSVGDKIAHVFDHVPGMNDLSPEHERYVKDMARRYYFSAENFFTAMQTRLGKPVQLVYLPETLRGIGVVY